MSLTLNMVGGGGGGLKDTDAVLVATVPTGSAVTMTKGAITLTPTIWTRNADNTLDAAIFSIPASTFDANAWTVTATLGADSASNTITINSAKEYDIELSYKLYLYQAGDTSGWTNLPWKGNSQWTANAASITYYTTNMTVSQTTSHSSVTYHTATVDLTDRSVVVFEISSWAAASNSANGVYVFSSLSTGTIYPNAAAAHTDKSGTGTQTITVDVSALIGSYYVGIGTARTSSTNTIAVITEAYTQ